MSNVPTTTNEVGNTVAATPIRIVATETAQDETGKTVASLPIRIVTGTTDTDETGKKVGVMPIVQVAGLTTTDETGKAISVRPAKVSAAAGAIPVRDIGATITLGALTLSGSLQIGTATSGTINGATVGSTITGNIPGITINSGARTYSGTPTGSAQTIANGLVETLAGASNSPHSSAVTVAGLSRRTPPAIFFSTAFPVQLVYNAAGSTPAARYSTNYATANFKHTGSIYYVDAALGNDSTGTGSSAAPYATIQAAHDAVAAGSQLYVRPGIYPQVITTKNITIVVDPASPGDVIAGDLLKSSDIASISTLSGGVQTVTLTSGFMHGFVDRTLTYEADCGGAWLVAQYSVNAAKINARQALTPPRAGIVIGYTGTNYTNADAIIGTADARALTAADFGPNILAWKKGAAAPLKVGNGTVCYTSGIKWIGGKERVVGQASGAATLVDEGCWFLGQGSDNGLVEGAGDVNPDNTDQVLKVFGFHIGVGSSYIGSNIAFQDVVDYDSGVSNCAGVHINCYFGQGGNRNGDQGSTTHGGIGILAVGNTYFDCSQDIGDLGPSISLHANSKHKAGMQSLGTMFGAFNSPVDMYIADAQRLNAAVGPADMVTSSPSHLFDLDGSTATLRLSAGATGTFHQWGGTSDPTGDAYLARIIANKAYLFQDAAGTNPVTASGQTVARIQDAIAPAVYYTVLVGTVTYTEGVVNSLTFNNAGLQTNGRVEPYGVCDLICALKGSGVDGSGTTGSVDLIGATNTGASYYGGMWTSGNAPYAVIWAGVTPTFKVDGAVKTTKTAMRTAALDNGLAHVVTGENVDLSFASLWNGHAIFNQSTTTGTQYTFTGDLTDYAITRHTGNTTAFNAYVTAAQATIAGL